MPANHKCHCTDPGCPMHKGHSACLNQGPTQILYRVDMDDNSGTPMCSTCALDAANSGLFSCYSADDHAYLDAEDAGQEWADSQENASPRCVW